MFFLFSLLLTTSFCFSIYLKMTAIGIVNPAVYVFLSWCPVVAAHYIAWFLERWKLLVFNRAFVATIHDDFGNIWNGAGFVKDCEEPFEVYNDVQVTHEINRINKIIGPGVFYVRIVPIDYEEVPEGEE